MKKVLLALAAGSALGIPFGFRAKRNEPQQSTSDRIAQIDTANAKRARKAEKRRREAGK
jgi:hypothetical protein